MLIPVDPGSHITRLVLAKLDYGRDREESKFNDVQRPHSIPSIEVKVNSGRCKGVI